jgi:coenzyme PQQ precursor peptide PqqA
MEHHGSRPLALAELPDVDPMAMPDIKPAGIERRRGRVQWPPVRAIGIRRTGGGRKDGRGHARMISAPQARARFMKFMRAISWWQGWGRRHRAGIIWSREPCPDGASGVVYLDDAVMPAHRRRIRSQCRKETLFMKWTTPTATDFRFGFEITMYIAAR